MPYWFKENMPPTWHFKDGDDGGGGGGGSNDGNNGDGGGSDNDDGGGGGDNSGGSESWRDGLPEDIRGSKDLEKFDSVDALAKSYIHASSLIGRDKIPMPKTDAEWDDVYTRLGRPEKPEEYITEVSEKLPDALKGQLEQIQPAFKAIAHKHGLNPKQATGFFKDYVDLVAKGDSDAVSMRDMELTEATEALKSELGDAYNAKIHLANRAIDHFASSELVDMLAKSGLGRNPHMVKAFIKVGELIAEDLGLDKNGAATSTPQDLQDQITELQAESAYLNESDPKHSIVVRQVEGLMKRLYPDT